MFYLFPFWSEFTKKKKFKLFKKSDHRRALPLPVTLAQYCTVTSRSWPFSDVRLVQIQVNRGQEERREGMGCEQRGQEWVLRATLLFCTVGGVSVLQKPRGLLILRTFSDLCWDQPGRCTQDREGRRKRGAGSRSGAGGGRGGGRQTASYTLLIFPFFILIVKHLQSK